MRVRTSHRARARSHDAAPNRLAKLTEVKPELDLEIRFRVRERLLFFRPDICSSSARDWGFLSAIKRSKSWLSLLSASARDRKDSNQSAASLSTVSG